MAHMPDVVNYSIVDIGETVCIAIAMAALRDLDIKAADILNSYVTCDGTLQRKDMDSTRSEFGDNLSK